MMQPGLGFDLGFGMNVKPPDSSSLATASAHILKIQHQIVNHIQSQLNDAAQTVSNLADTIKGTLSRRLDKVVDNVAGKQDKIMNKVYGLAENSALLALQMGLDPTLVPDPSSGIDVPDVAYVCEGQLELTLQNLGHPELFGKVFSDLQWYDGATGLPVDTPTPGFTSPPTTFGLLPNSAVNPLTIPAQFQQLVQTTCYESSVSPPPSSVPVLPVGSTPPPSYAPPPPTSTPINSPTTPPPVPPPTTPPTTPPVLVSTSGGTPTSATCLKPDGSGFWEVRSLSTSYGETPFCDRPYCSLSDLQNAFAAAGIPTGFWGEATNQFTYHASDGSTGQTFDIKGMFFSQGNQCCIFALMLNTLLDVATITQSITLYCPTATQISSCTGEPSAPPVPPGVGSAPPPSIAPPLPPAPPPGTLCQIPCPPPKVDVGLKPVALPGGLDGAKKLVIDCSQFQLLNVGSEQWCNALDAIMAAMAEIGKQVAAAVLPFDLDDFCTNPDFKPPAKPAMDWSKLIPDFSNPLQVLLTPAKVAVTAGTQVLKSAAANIIAGVLQASGMADADVAQAIVNFDLTAMSSGLKKTVCGAYFCPFAEGFGGYPELVVKLL